MTLRRRGKRRSRRFEPGWKERRSRKTLSMADRGESEEETQKLRASVLETANAIFQIRLQAEQEVRRANEILEQRTRELSRALVVMRATLESTTDAILVTDEMVRVTDFNEKFLALWKLPEELMESGNLGELREKMSQNFADPQRFL